METLLDPHEEMALNTVTNLWQKDNKKISITELKDELGKMNIELSHEKTRMIVNSLWRKGEVLIDVQGRERMIRPNHVIVNSKTKPIEFRNFTVNDDDGKPLQRIWLSIYEEDGNRYFSISESRWNGSWKTTSNIIIPPNAIEDFKILIEFIKDVVIKK